MPAVADMIAVSSTCFMEVRMPEPITCRLGAAARRILAGLCLLSAVGCAGILAPAQTAIDPEQGWTEEVQRQLAQRAQARWEAISAGDYEKAYEFETPAYRSVFSIQQYRGRFGNAVVWKSARVLATQYDESHMASVSVAVEYEALVSLAGSMRNVRVMAEKWLYSDGAWWYISQ
jgi:hypothetical protein